jgi:hypothetical protein
VRRSHRTSLLASLALALAPAALAAQEPTQQPAELPAQLPPEVQEWVMEMQQIQAALASVQERALSEDPALQEEQEQLSAAVQEAMIEIDPTIPQQAERMEALFEEAQAAQAAEDGDRIVAISAEAQEIQERFRHAQNEALQHPDIAPRLDAFQSRLQERMVEIDPDVEGRLERLDELERQVVAALQQ